jgi:hypothetical protein
LAVLQGLTSLVPSGNRRYQQKIQDSTHELHLYI